MYDPQNLPAPDPSMAKIVMKFGGTSVADIGRIRNVANLVKREVDRGHQVAVVVSAMAGETNKLVAWVKELSPLHDAREYDTVVAAGEQVTAGLLAVALSALGRGFGKVSCCAQLKRSGALLAGSANGGFKKRLRPVAPLMGRQVP